MIVSNAHLSRYRKTTGQVFSDIAAKFDAAARGSDTLETHLLCRHSRNEASDAVLWITTRGIVLQSGRGDRAEDAGREVMKFHEAEGDEV